MGYDAIIFDMDGVLVSGWETDQDVYRQATAKVLHAFGHPDAEEWSAEFQYPESAGAYREACQRWDVPAEAAWAYRERAASQFENERIDRGERPAFPDAEVIEALGETYALGIVSNNRHETVGFCVDTFGWSETFDAYRGRFPTLDDFDRMKPDPAYLTWTLRRLDADATLFVGDRSSDVIAAERAGCDAALLEREAPAAGAEDVEPAYRLTSLAELAELHGQGWPNDDA